jgi:uncharacterized protein
MQTADGQEQVPFHEGERAVQSRAGVERIAAQVGRNIVSWIAGEHARFLRQQPFVVIAGRDARERVWASLLVGGVGFARALDDRRLMLAGELAAMDPLAAAFDAPSARIGILAIEPDTRSRIRLNGAAERTPDGILVTVDEAFGNCPKYIQRSLPMERLEPPGEPRPTGSRRRPMARRPTLRGDLAGRAVEWTVWYSVCTV